MFSAERRASRTRGGRSACEFHDPGCRFPTPTTSVWRAPRDHIVSARPSPMSVPSRQRARSSARALLDGRGEPPYRGRLSSPSPVTPWSDSCTISACTIPSSASAVMMSCDEVALAPAPERARSASGATGACGGAPRCAHGRALRPLKAWYCGTTVRRFVARPAAASHEGGGPACGSSRRRGIRRLRRRRGDGCRSLRWTVPSRAL